MSGPTLLFIAIGLSLDAFAVALATSVVLPVVSIRHVFRLSFHFGLFQAGMPVLGWLAGRSVSGLIDRWDHWVAFALLAAVGCKAIYSAIRHEREQPTKRDPTRGVNLVLLSVATSLDALAVGVTFAMLGVAIWYPALVIGLITASFTVIGTWLGSRLGAHFGRLMEFLGGAVLITIGLKIAILPGA
jgi:manganese efflux pump family protein